MAESLSQDAPTLGTPKRFAFSLAAMLMAVSVFALSLGAAKARDIGTGILVGLLAAAICMLVRGKKAAGFSILLFLAFFFCVGTWVAWNARVSSTWIMGRLQDRQLNCHWSDKIYFDAYSLVLYTGDKNSDRIETRDRMLILPDRSIHFPGDADVAVVNEVGEVRFLTIPDHCFISKTKSSGLYVLAIPYPSFRSDRDFKGSLDRDSLEKTQIWKEEILPFLLPDTNADPGS